MIEILLNGLPHRVADGATLADLVRDITGQGERDPRGIAIERNLEIVPKSLHATTRLAPGDRLEIVQFVGGG